MTGRWVRCYNAEIETDRLYMRFYRWQDEVTPIYSDSLNKSYKDTNQFEIHIEVISKKIVHEVYEDFEITRTDREVIKRYVGRTDSKDAANAIWKMAKQGKIARKCFSVFEEID